MKKRILIGIFIILVVVTITGCGKKEDKNKKDLIIEDSGYGKTVLKYKQDKDYEVKEEVGGKYKEIFVTSNSENFTMQLYHTDSTDVGYNTGKDNRKENVGFKEYTWNGLNGYIYNANKNGVSFNILLKTTDGRAKVLFGNIEPNDMKTANVLELFESDDFQKMMSSITFSE